MSKRIREGKNAAAEDQRMKILVDPFDEARTLAVQRGSWVVGVIETRVYWPKKKQIIYFDEKCFLLLPFEQSDTSQTPTLPAIALRTETYQLSREDARREILRFASALSWREGQKIGVIGWGGGNLPRSFGLRSGQVITEYLDSKHLPAPANEAARKALAFYREGLSLDNPFYSFLSFYKAFSVAVPAREREKWMTAKGKLLGREAKERLSQVETQGVQVGNYLQQQCRHAVAHADREPFVNPDNMDDHFRVTKDILLIRKFAELAIEEVFEIKSLSTIYDEHLFELEGFRQILPPELLNALKQREQISMLNELDFPENLLLLATRGIEKYPLEKMEVIAGHWIVGGLILDFQSATDAIRLRVTLNFAEERLQFDPLQDIAITQYIPNAQIAREALAALQFQRCILLNGHLEIWDVNAEKQLGCSEMYVPLNSFVNTKFFEEQIAKLTKILSQND